MSAKIFLHIIKFKQAEYFKVFFNFQFVHIFRIFNAHKSLMKNIIMYTEL